MVIYFASFKIDVFVTYIWSKCKTKLPNWVWKMKSNYIYPLVKEKYAGK